MNPLKHTTSNIFLAAGLLQIIGSLLHGDNADPAALLSLLWPITQTILFFFICTAGLGFMAATADASPAACALGAVGHLADLDQHHSLADGKSGLRLSAARNCCATTATQSPHGAARPSHRLRLAVGANHDLHCPLCTRYNPVWAAPSGVQRRCPNRPGY